MGVWLLSIGTGCSTQSSQCLAIISEIAGFLNEMVEEGTEIAGVDLVEELREGLPGRLNGICGRCLMKKICLGSCIAQNYYGSKNLWSPYWYCEEAGKAGLFPETRMEPAPGTTG